MLKKFNDHLHQIPRFSGLKLFNKFDQLKVLTTADYRNMMKTAIFALDDIFDTWAEITCKELCILYAKFGEMYIMSRKDSFTWKDLEDFEVNFNND